MLHHHLVAFVKTPRLGRVKSRLADDIGVVAAWRFYRTTMTFVLRQVDGGGRWRKWIAVTPDSAVATPTPWPRGWQRMPQGPGDLGARMTRVMKTMPPGPVVIIGTDIPDIRSRHVAEAFRALGRHEAVFGPAEDGGYWLAGLRRRPRCPDIFSGVRWSTPVALADTLANFPLSDVAILETLQDIDNGADMERRRQRRRNERQPPPAMPCFS